MYSQSTLTTVKDNGMVQICQDGQWVAVCDEGWNQTHSIVLCKGLGYNDPSENWYIYIFHIFHHIPLMQKKVLVE